MRSDGHFHCSPGSRGTLDSTDFLVLVSPLSRPVHAEFELRPRDHPTDSGTYADDCLVQRVTVNKCYIVATVSFILASQPIQPHVLNFLTVLPNDTV